MISSDTPDKRYFSYIMGMKIKVNNMLTMLILQEIVKRNKKQ
jgi:hypothetical protein